MTRLQASHLAKSLQAYFKSVFDQVGIGKGSPNDNIFVASVEDLLRT